MNNLFLLLVLLCVFALVIGIIKPKVVVRWGEIESRNRKTMFKYYGVGFLVFFILFGITTPDDLKTSNNLNVSKMNQEKNIENGVEKILDSNKKEVPTIKKEVSTIKKEVAITKKEVAPTKKEVTIIDFSKMNKEQVENWAETNKLTCTFKESYSDSITKGSLITQTYNSNKPIYEGDNIEVLFSLGKEPGIEFNNALDKAKTYSETMNMSKKGIYDQLTSEYGEKFGADAAQYAVDNLKTDYNYNALEKAKTYQKDMSMSNKAIYDQLISKYGEKFTKEEAQYAIDNLDK